MADEELAAGAVRVAGAGHGQDALHVRAVVELGLHLVAGAAGAGHAAGADLGIGAASLNHEALDDAVEGRAVIELLAGQLEEVLHGARGDVRPELDGHVAEVGVDDGAGGGTGGGGFFHGFFIIGAGGKGEAGHDGQGGEQAEAQGFHGFQPISRASARNPKPPLASPPTGGQGRPVCV